MRDATRTHEEGIKVRLPEATDQIRLAPVRALRAVFSGVGQLLLAADRLREEDARQENESGDDQPDTLASWDGRLSSSVRLITPPGTRTPSSRGAGAAPGGQPEATGRKSGPRGRRSGPTSRKSERAAGDKPERDSESRRAGGQPKPGGQRGQSAAGKARPADSARAERPGKATKPTNRGGKTAADAKRASGSKAGNAGSGRKSGRSKNAVEASRFRSLDLTGNVRMLTDEDVADLAAEGFERNPADAQPHRPTGPAPARVSDFLPTVPRAAELPISGYDELSLPSLRARLRNLGAPELRDLLAYERSHANREDVVTMFERRIVKLEEVAD